LIRNPMVRAAGLWCCPVLHILVVAGVADRSIFPDKWRLYGKQAFVEFLTDHGCHDCASLAAHGSEQEPPFTVSSQIFGCADVDVLLPSLHLLYQSARVQLDGELPGLLVDGGANVGRATARWMAALGDAFGRRVARNTTQTPYIICAGADAASPMSKGSSGAAQAPPSLVVVAVEPSENNFALLSHHAATDGWDNEGFLAINAALGNETGEAEIAVSGDFAIDETATLQFDKADPRLRQKVRIVTLNDVVRSAEQAYPGLGFRDRGIFMLKLDIEGMEPAVLRSIAEMPVPVKFVSFEYASNVWREKLGSVVKDLFVVGFFCFLVTSERLFPVSGVFWDALYELPMWSNLFCGHEDDSDLDALLQLHSGSVGLWPRLPRTFLEGFAGGDDTPYTFTRARHRCDDLGVQCGGVTCECREGGCSASAWAPWKTKGSQLGPCTVREGASGTRRSPREEVTFLRDAAAGELYLLYRRATSGVN